MEKAGLGSRERLFLQSAEHMDKLQGGDWNSFFHQFEAVASQSTASVSRPSIVDDNVPLPIIRGHHFDIVYHDAMDEHVKCQ
ncbi:hypothetical protein OSTOST_05113, partial [Ostertagia ostertagi]